MCGIVGIIAMGKEEIPTALVDLFDHMLYMDAIRGPNSTGVMTISEGNDVSIHKAAAHAADFIWSKGYDKFRKKMKNTRAIIGHNRWATVGNVTSKNAHPFLHGDICLMHNGTLKNHKDLGHDIEVDSDALTKELNTIGWEPTLQKINGNYALVWINHKEKSLNMIRNHERPLAIADVMYMNSQYAFIASEGMMLEWLVKRHRTAYLKGIVNNIDVDQLLKFQYQDKYEGGPPTVTKEKFTKVYPKHRYIGQGYWDADNGYESGCWEDNVFHPFTRGEAKVSPVQQETKQILRNMKRVPLPDLRTNSGTTKAKDKQAHLVGLTLHAVAEDWTPFGERGTKGRLEFYAMPYQPDGMTDVELIQVRDHNIIVYGIDKSDWETTYKEQSNIWKLRIRSQYGPNRTNPNNQLIVTIEGMVPDLFYSSEDDDVYHVGDPTCLVPLSLKEEVQEISAEEVAEIKKRLQEPLVKSSDTIGCDSCKHFYPLKQYEQYGKWGDDGDWICFKCLKGDETAWQRYWTNLTGEVH